MPLRLVSTLTLALLLAGCTVGDDIAAISPNASPSTQSTDIATAAANDDAQAIEPGAAAQALADGDEPTVAVETAAVAETDVTSAADEGSDTASEVVSVDTSSETQAPEQAVTVAADPASSAAGAGNDASVESEATSTPALAVVAESQPAARSPFARLFSRPSEQPQATGGQDADRSEAVTVSDAAGATDADVEGAVAQDDIAPAAEEPITTASIAAPAIEQPRAQLSVTAGDDAPLPGVRQVSSLYQIGQRDSFDPENYEDTGVIQVASAAGLAGLTGGRLAVQHEKVDVSCLKPKLVQTLRQIERRFGKPVVVTSGFRNKSYNRMVGGARESKHMSCEAADIQVAGVSKWDIAEYVRSLPGRGGVGTYCHTESVHVDIGSKRDWNWRCRRRG